MGYSICSLTNIDEVAVYDRQIRLWGMEAQARMRNAKVLIINLGSLATETVKNLVLAGIGAITIVDENRVVAEDLGANFFLTDEDVGKNRALAAQRQIEKLNPRVAVSCEEKSEKSIDSKWLANYDLVLATELDYSQFCTINEASREAKRPFYAAGLCGLFGFVFADLIEHTFTIDRVNPNTGQKLGPETSTREIVSVDTKEEGGTVTQVVKKIERYRPLKQVVEGLGENFGSGLSNRQKLRVDPLLAMLLAQWDGPYENEDQLKTKAAEKCKQLGLPAEIVTDSAISFFYNGIGAEFSPVAAILGGVLAQNILNYFSQSIQPIQNTLLFNGLTNEGPIYVL